MSFKIAIVQTHIEWEEIDTNLNLLSKLFLDIDKDVDLIVLPEMFATGFSMNTVVISQKMDGVVVEWLKMKAELTGAAIMGTQAIYENGRYYNRALFVTPNEQVSYYDKRHVFSPGGENKHYAAGTERKVFNYKGVRILPEICYDLRFPVWSRNRGDYDLAIYMANWPAARQNVWNTLIKARAIENQCYVCAVNCIGQSGGINYVGGSQVIDFKGNELLNIEQKINIVSACNIDFVLLKSFKEKFPTHYDADDFRII